MFKNFKEYSLEVCFEQFFRKSKTWSGIHTCIVYLKKHLATAAFCSVSTFSQPSCYILCMPSVAMSMSLIILVYLSSKGLEKTYIDFSNNTFPIDTCITNLFHYIWGIWLIYKILNFNDRLEIWWRHQKVTWPWLLFWYFLEDLM